MANYRLGITRDPLADLDGGTDSAHGVVLVRDREPEEGDHQATHDGLHASAITVQHRRGDRVRTRTGGRQRLDVHVMIRRRHDLEPDDCDHAALMGKPPFGHSPRGWPRPQRGVLAEHRGLNLTQVGTGLDAELVHQQVPGGAVRRKSIGLTTGTVEGEHLQATHPLPERVLGDELVELGNQSLLPARLEVGLDARFERGQPQFFQGGDGALGKRMVSEVSECRPAPDCQRFGEEFRAQLRRPAGRLIQKLLETTGINIPRPDGQTVAASLGDQQSRASEGFAVGLKQLAQLQDMQLEDRARGGRGLLAPQLVDKTLGRDGVARVQDKHRQESTGASARYIEAPGSLANLQRSEDAEFHQQPPPPDPQHQFSTAGFGFDEASARL